MPAPWPMRSMRHRRLLDPLLHDRRQDGGPGRRRQLGLDRRRRQRHALEQLGGRRAPGSASGRERTSPCRCPVGTDRLVKRSTPSRSRAMAAPAMSAMLSRAPTSWKWTFSSGMPWAAASASASRRKMRRARSRCAVGQLAALQDRLDVGQVSGASSSSGASMRTYVAAKPPLRTFSTSSWIGRPSESRPARIGVGVDAGVEEGGQRHVAADAAETVEVQRAHKESSLRRILLAGRPSFSPLGRSRLPGGTFCAGPARQAGPTAGEARDAISCRARRSAARSGRSPVAARPSPWPAARRGRASRPGP